MISLNRPVFVLATRCEQSDLEYDDISSNETIQMAQINSSSGYHSQNPSSRRSVQATAKWRTRNKLRCLKLATFLMAVTILILLRLLVLHWHDNKTRCAENKKSLNKNLTNVDEEQLCETFTSNATGPCLNKYCIFAASEIIKSLDISVDPCEDFYGFACNQWIRENPLPHGRTSWNTFDKLEKRNQMVIRDILEKPFSYFKSEAEKKAKRYYQSCMDKDENIEKLGGDPMLHFIREVGGWNISTVGFRIDEWSMESTMKNLQNRYNMGGYFSWTIGEDNKNSSNHVIQVDQGDLALPTPEHYLNAIVHEKVRTAYLEYMTKIGVLLGGEKVAVKRQMRDVLEFETAIAGITEPPTEEPMYHSMSLRDVDALVPFMNFTSHFEDVLKTIGRKVTKDQRVTVCEPEFLKSLSTLVQEYQKTERGRIALNNYLVWQGVRTLTSRLSKPFRDAFKGVRRALLDSEGNEETWRYCVGDTNKVIGFAVGAMFVREAFHGDAKHQAEKMINNVRNAFKNNLRKIPWMDAQTRKNAKEKADSITDMIGFPEYILNSIQLDEKYNDLQLKANEYFNNNLRIRQFNLKTNLEKLDTPVKKSAWEMTPSTVTAYYTPTLNQIVFPAGILQKPFFDVHYPKSLNYGAIGMAMGHELTHAFDDQVRVYDKNGKLQKWLNPNSVKKFVKRKGCLIKQYGKFKVLGMNVNGKQTLGENIADNGGLKAAFNAYINSKSEKEADYLPLPGVNLTHRQLFFVSFAQVWCSSVTDEEATSRIEKGIHAPPKFRVKGPLSNFREFSKEFNCPVGSRMNPKKKCEVW